MQSENVDFNQVRVLEVGQSVQMRLIIKMFIWHFWMSRISGKPVILHFERVVIE